MEIYSMTYISLFMGQLYTETTIYNNREDWEKAYKDSILDIADNIADDEEKEKFLKEYESKFSWDAHWETWDGDERYLLETNVHTIEYREDFWETKEQ